MQITKRYVIHLSYQTPIVPFNFFSKSVLRFKHTMAWHVMQSYCAQQRSLENSRLQLFLHGGERVNRTVLLYTPVFSTGLIQHHNSLNYVVPAGIHFTLDDLRAMGKLQNKQSEFYALPKSVLVIQQNERLQHNAWEPTDWLSGPQWRQMRQELLSLAMRLLMRRGVQADLAEVFVRRLGQAQSSRLQSRLENFHPQSLPLVKLQAQFIRRYGDLFLGLQAPNNITVFRDRVLPGLHESRRARRRRGKLRGLSLFRGLFELRPRLGTTNYLSNTAILARPQQVNFLNMLMLLSRQTLRSEWRRRRGTGLLHRVLRKGGRLFWDLPVTTYSWPLRQRNLRVHQNVVDTTSHPLYSAKGVLSLPPHDLMKREASPLDTHSLSIARAFPFLFPSVTPLIG